MEVGALPPRTSSRAGPRRRRRVARDDDARERVPGRASRRVAFAPPAVVSADLAAVHGGRITSLVFESDLVPRFSLAAAAALMRRIDAVEWRPVLSGEWAAVRDDWGARMIEELRGAGDAWTSKLNEELLRTKLGR